MKNCHPKSYGRAFVATQRQREDKRAPAPIHGRPLFAKPSRYDGKKVKIAAIHPDFGEAYASVPDGIR